MIYRQLFVSAATLAVSLLLTACSDTSTDSDARTDKHSEYIELGDLTEIKQRGTLRLLRLHWEGLSNSHKQTAEPADERPLQRQQQLAEGFAQQLGLRPQWINVDSYRELSEALLKGQGDIIASNFTQTPAREQAFIFSLPLDQTQEFIVSRLGEPLESIDALHGLRIAIRAGSSFQTSLLDLLDSHPQLTFEIVILNSDDTPSTILEQLKNGHFDATVMDSNIITSLAKIRHNFHIGTEINDRHNVALAMRPNSVKLQESLNQYLLETFSQQARSTRYTDGWKGIVERKTLRVITRNTPASYFLWRGELMGFDYELIRHFAQQHELTVDVVVAPPSVDLIDWLLEGRGDVIAATMTASDARRQRGVSFSQPYNHIAEQLVTSQKQPSLNNLESLHNRTLALHPNSHYWHTAKRLQASGHQFTIETVPENISTAEILKSVAEGQYDATLADSHIVSIEQRFLDQLTPGLTLEPKLAHAWATRPENAQLQQQLNNYLQSELKGRHFNVLKQKYFSDSKKIQQYQGQRIDRDTALSPFDSIVKRFASQHQLDWRLVTAQMYQESRFNPSARSHVGALGLMQVMPKTARELGYTLPFTAQSGIEAGIDYLAWCRDRFEATLPPQERLWFSLAAYNAGAGHVFDARKLAKQQELNPDVWFDNVEHAMLLLSQRQYYKKARYGYVRGSEPAGYIRGIRQRYQAYIDWSQAQQAASATSATLEKSTEVPASAAIPATKD